MDNLMNNSRIEITDSTKKINIKGETKNLAVYKIPLDLLYYNSKNDRISTWISKYEAEYGDIDKLDKEKLNSVIEDYIIKADEKAFKRTKDNMQRVSQLDPGVVFTDGRVIDGNRRFTCLRKLYQETGEQKFGYFEAVILENTITDKEIKIMELELQHGKEERVDYNPIEKLVGVYKDIIKNKLITVEEYANSVSKPVNDIKKMVSLAELMIDFLEYINAPEQFYVARDLVIDGPLHEALNIKNKINDPDKWEQAKIIIFDNILMKTSQGSNKDISRIIRSIGSDIIKNDEVFEEYYEKHLPFAQEINDIVSEPEMVTTSYINENIRGNLELKEKMDTLVTDTLYDLGKEKAKNAPTDLANNALKDLKKIDLIQVSKYKGQAKKDLLQVIQSLYDEINKIEDSIDELE